MHVVIDACMLLMFARTQQHSRSTTARDTGYKGGQFC